MGHYYPPNTLQWGEAENVCSSSPSLPPARMQLPADWIMNQTLIDTCSQPGETGGVGGPRCPQALGGGCGGLHSDTFTDLLWIGEPQPASRGCSCLSFPPCGTSHVQWAEDQLRAVRGHAYAGVCPCVSSGGHKHISRAIKGRKGLWQLLSITCSKAGFLPPSAGLGGRARPPNWDEWVHPSVSQPRGPHRPKMWVSQGVTACGCGISLCWHCSALVLIFEGQWGLGYRFQNSHAP